MSCLSFNGRWTATRREAKAYNIGDANLASGLLQNLASGTHCRHRHVSMRRGPATRYTGAGCCHIGVQQEQSVGRAATRLPDDHIMHPPAPTHSSLSRTFQHLFASTKAGGMVLIACTILSLLLANSSFGASYLGVWQRNFGGMSVEHWINDGLMAIFFLMIGLELKREVVNGELSDLRNALLPIVAALGGIGVPALLHFSLNAGSATQAGIGIPMATDIAFALGVLAILGSRVPSSLKIFLTALAVIDDLCAIIVIAVFYTGSLQPGYLLGAMAVFGILMYLNRAMRIVRLLPYLIGGVLMWICMLKSGIHATVAGVLLAFTIPCATHDDSEASASHMLERLLHAPTTFLILPLFALANTGMVIGTAWAAELLAPNSLGILAGLVLGKPAGIVVFSAVAVALGLCTLPADLAWRHVLGGGLLGGIGFTMSIFITNLAFPGDAALITASKIAILIASLVAGLAGLAWLRFAGGNKHDVAPATSEAISA
jgi:NhaA family Na+:H+ antiporter